MTLAGRTLFMTGGSRGIGLAIALRAARDGANIAIAAKTSERHAKLPGTIHTAAAAIEAAGGRALPLQVDVRDDDALVGAIAKTAAHFGGIDICINNASAIDLASTLERLDEALRSTSLDQCSGYIRRQPLLHSVAAQKFESTYIDPIPAPRLARLVVRGTPSVYVVQIRNVDAGLRNGGGISR